jgi:hypothetical protein
MIARASRKFSIAGAAALSLALAAGAAYAGCAYDAGWSYRHGNWDGSGGNYSCYGGGTDCRYEGGYRAHYRHDGCCHRDGYDDRDRYYRDGDDRGWHRDGYGRDGYDRDGRDGDRHDGDYRDGDHGGWNRDSGDHR